MQKASCLPPVVVLLLLGSLALATQHARMPKMDEKQQFAFVTFLGTISNHCGGSVAKAFVPLALKGTKE